MTTPEQLAPLMLRPQDAAAAIGIGRTKMFELIASGEVASVLIGRCRCVPHSALQQYVLRLLADSAGDE